MRLGEQEAGSLQAFVQMSNKGPMQGQRSPDHHLDAGMRQAIGNGKKRANCACR